MARQNRTRFAVLGMLAHGQMSGYDLKKHFERSVGHFWTESVGQIYPTLRALEDRGWAQSKLIPQDRRPDRTVYSITAKGRRALAEWLSMPTAPNRVRNELLLKIYLGTEMDPALALTHVERHEDQLRESLAIFQAYEPQIAQEAGSDEQELFWKLTLESGLLMTRARLQWCKRAKAQIREFFGAAAEPTGDAGRGARHET